MDNIIVVKWGSEILGLVSTPLKGKDLKKAFATKAQEMACGSIDPLLEDPRFRAFNFVEVLDINDY